MPLVNEKEIISEAFTQKKAIGAFNANNMEMVQAFVQGAEEMTEELRESQALIIQLSPGAAKYAGWELGAGMVKIAAQHSNIRIALNLDHATNMDEIRKACDAGFTAMLLDGSSLYLEDNIALTKQAVEYCHALGKPVEAELGKIPKIEDYFSLSDIGYLRSLPAFEAVAVIRQKAGQSVEDLMAKPDDVVRFVEATECDFLAAAFGSIHGIWDDIWPVRIDRLREIQAKIPIPIVSHGSSGILMTPKAAKEKGIELAEGEGTLLDAIQTGGVTKVNVATIFSIAFIEGFTKAFANNPDEKDFRKLGGPARDCVKETTKRYLRLFAGVV